MDCCLFLNFNFQDVPTKRTDNLSGKDSNELLKQNTTSKKTTNTKGHKTNHASTESIDSDSEVSWKELCFDV